VRRVWSSETELFASISECAPENQRGWLGLAKQGLKKSDTAARESAFVKATSLDHLYAQDLDQQTAYKLVLAHEHFGHWLYTGKGDMEGAEAQFKAAFRFEERALADELYREAFSKLFAEFHFTYGTLLHRLHGAKEAAKEYQAANELDPNNKEAASALAMVGGGDTFKAHARVENLVFQPTKTVAFTLDISQESFAAFNPSIFEDVDGAIGVVFQVSNHCMCVDCSPAGPEVQFAYKCSLNTTEWEAESCGALPIGVPKLDHAGCGAAQGINGPDSYTSTQVGDAHVKLFTAPQCVLNADGSGEVRHTTFVARGQDQAVPLSVPGDNGKGGVWLPFTTGDDGQTYISRSLEPSHVVYTVDVDQSKSAAYGQASGTYDSSLLLGRAKTAGMTYASIRSCVPYVRVGTHLIGIALVEYPPLQPAKSAVSGHMHMWFAIATSAPFDIVAASAPFKFPGKLADSRLDPESPLSDVQIATGMVKRGGDWEAGDDNLIVSYGEANCDGALAVYRSSAVLGTMGLD
jgi:tetratricopeptide (TPR) repeat protein